MLSYDEPIIEQVVINTNDPAVTCAWYRIKKDIHCTQSTDTQQLKAEIAMQARSLELNFNDTTVVRHIAESLLQLSAV